MGWVKLVLVTAISAAVGFVIGRTVGRGDIVGALLVLSIPTAAIAIAPVYSHFDDPDVGDDFGGIAAVALMFWLVFWFDVGMTAGWLRHRSGRRAAG